MMTHISDESLGLTHDENHIGNEGAYLEDPKTKRFLNLARNAGEEKFGLKSEYVPSDKVENIDGRISLTEKSVVDVICAEWGETPDTLIPTHIAKIDNSDGLLITESFESTFTEAGGDILKIVYQFTRKGTYDDTNMPSTEITRYEFTKIEHGNKGKGILEVIAPDGRPLQMELPEDPAKFLLKPNQFVDEDNESIVTYYKVKI